MANEFPEAGRFRENSMSLRDAIEYIRNDEAYVAAVAHADNHDALRAAAEAAVKVLQMEFPGSIKRKAAIDHLRAALHPQPGETK